MRKSIVNGGAAIQEYILRSWSLVKMSAGQRRDHCAAKPWIE
jgi:hypothetical protein